MFDQPDDEAEKQRGSSRSLFALVALVVACIIGVVVLQSRNREYQPQSLAIGFNTSRVLQPAVDGKIDFLGALNQSISLPHSVDDCLASPDNAFIEFLSLSEPLFSGGLRDVYAQAMGSYQVDVSGKAATDMLGDERAAWLVGLSKKPRLNALWFVNEIPADGRASGSLMLDSGNAAELVIEQLMFVSAHANHAMLRGDFEAAVEYSEALLRLRELARKSLLLKAADFPFDGFDSWFQVETDILVTGQLSIEQLQKHLRQLQNNRPQAYVRDFIDKECRFRMLDLLQQMGKHGAESVVDTRGHWVKLHDVEKDYNEVTNLFRAVARANINAEATLINEAFDEFVKALDNPAVATRWTDLGIAVDSFDMFSYSGRQPLSSMLMRSYRDPFLEMYRWQAESMIEHELACVATALELYRKESGHYPARLKDLVPKYLAAEPQDPINQVPFQYSIKSDSVLLYSIGIDGTHNGGMDRDEAGLAGSESYDHRYLNGKLGDF